MAFADFYILSSDMNLNDSITLTTKLIIQEYENKKDVLILSDDISVSENLSKKLWTKKDSYIPNILQQEIESNFLSYPKIILTENKKYTTKNSDILFSNSINLHQYFGKFNRIFTIVPTFDESRTKYIREHFKAYKTLDMKITTHHITKKSQL